MKAKWQIVKLIFYAICFLIIAYASILIYNGRYAESFPILSIVLILLFLDIIILTVKKFL